MCADVWSVFSDYQEIAVGKGFYDTGQRAMLCYHCLTLSVGCCYQTTLSYNFISLSLNDMTLCIRTYKPSNQAAGFLCVGHDACGV